MVPKARQIVFVVAVILNLVVAGYCSFVSALLLMESDPEGPLWFLLIPVAAITALIALFWRERISN